jgi:uncharacterized protein
MTDPQKKERKLDELLARFARAVVAYSGGVDSAYLAFRAHRVLGERALAVTAESASLSSHQRELADDFARRYGLRRRIVHSREMTLPEFCANSSSRCFHCKDALFAQLGEVAREFGADVVLDGLNTDDLDDYRPGRSAAEKHRVRSPLMEVGLAKSEIRALSRMHGLPTADEPASACLASRIPYGVPITEEALRIVDRGEETLRGMGFKVFRVRHHEHLVRLEFGPEDLAKALDPAMAARLASAFKGLSYKYVTLDLEGYRTGSGNEVLSAEEKDRFRS